MRGKTRYTVKTKMFDLQLVAFGDHFSKFEILVERNVDANGATGWKHWQPGMPRSEHSMNWAKRLVKALCQDFREKGDEDGRTGMDAAMFPHLADLDVEAGLIKATIRRSYTG